MNAQTHTCSLHHLRLQQRAPRYDKSAGDSIWFGFDAAINEATRRARETGQRQVVTRGRYSLGSGLTTMRVQAWR